MKATYIIVLINLAIVCYGLSPVKGYNNGDPIYCSSKRISTDVGAKAYSEDYCRSLYCAGDCFRCCYVHAKLDGKTHRGCYPFTYANYANASEIDPADLEDGNGNSLSSFTDLSIHCDSKYLTITASFIALMVALF